MYGKSRLRSTLLTLVRPSELRGMIREMFKLFISYTCLHGYAFGFEADERLKPSGLRVGRRYISVLSTKNFTTDDLL